MTDPTTLSPAELQQAGVVLTGYCHEEMRPTGGAVWKSHSEFLADHKTADQIERSAARLSAWAHLKIHDTLEGLRLPRSFPCLGRLRIVEDDGKRPATVCCDRCGFRLGVAQKALEQDAQGAAW